MKIYLKTIHISATIVLLMPTFYLTDKPRSPPPNLDDGGLKIIYFNRAFKSAHMVTKTGIWGKASWRFSKEVNLGRQFSNQALPAEFSGDSEGVGPRDFAPLTLHDFNVISEISFGPVINGARTSPEI